MGDFTARLSLTMRGWTGWSREQPLPQAVTLEAHCGQMLGPADFGLTGPDLEAFDSVYGCRIRLTTLFDDWAIFQYRRLLIQHREGSVDFALPAAGGFVLRPGQHIALATPTMDGGIRLSIALQGIEVTATRPAGARS